MLRQPLRQCGEDRQSHEAQEPSQEEGWEQGQSCLPAAELKALRAAGKELRLSFIPARLPNGKGAFPASVERLLNEML